MLSLKSVCKRYRDNQALNKVSFDVNPGEVVALLGANGSGKTTTVQAICGLVLFDQGDIHMQGQSIVNNREYLGRIGAVLDGSRNVNWRLTVAQNADYFSRLKGIPSARQKSYVAQLEQQLGLAEYRGQEVMKLSTGNRQKTAVLCALAHSPQLLLLDEPTLGLDLDTVAELQNIILSQVRHGEQGFLVTSHDMSFIDNICNKVVVLDQGNVIFHGCIDTLKRKLFSFELRLTCEQGQKTQVEQAIASLCSGSYQLRVEQEQVSLQYNAAAQVLPLLAWLAQQAWTPALMTIEQLTIEKAYRSLMAQESPL